MLLISDANILIDMEVGGLLEAEADRGTAVCRRRKNPIRLAAARTYHPIVP